MRKSTGWAPADLVESHQLFYNWPTVQSWQVRERLITDYRMKEVWQWLAGELTRTGTDPRDWGMIVCWAVQRGIRTPGKPHSLSKGERKKYFAAVSQQASKLLYLIEETGAWTRTRKERDTPPRYIPPDKLPAKVARRLKLRGPGRIVAFEVSRNGVSTLPWNYPRCDLDVLLKELRAWAERGGSLRAGKVRPVSPVEGVHFDSARTTYFCVVVYEALFKRRLTIPFDRLAILANVALELSTDDEVNEDSVRQQVTRYRNKRKVRSSSVTGPPEPEV